MTSAPHSRFRVVAALVAALALLAGALLVAAPAAQAVDTASISGTVHDTAAAPIEGAGVSIYRLSDGPLTLAGNASTDGTGAYTVPALPIGDYTILFTAGGYAAQYFDGSPSLDAATFVTLTAGEGRTGVDATLSHAGSVAGTIKNGDGDPESNLYVQAMKLLPGDTYTSAGMAYYTNGDGSFLIDGLPAGTYTLQLQGGGPNYPQQYLGGSTTVAGSTQFTLAEGENKAGIDGVVALTPSDGATVSGTVTRASGAVPMVNAVVTAYTFDAVLGWHDVGQVVTAADGTYSFTNLEPGTYRFGFARLGYTTQFWNGAATVSAGTSVDLTTQTVTGIDASMVDAVYTGTVAGTIVIGSGAASPLDVDVEVIDTVTKTVVETRSTEADGSYSVDGLAPATYTLRFHRDGTVPAVQTQYLGGGTSLAAAQTFTLVAAQVKTLDVTLKLASATTTSLSTGTRAFGTASTATVRVTAVGGTPTGLVAVKDGARTVAAATLVAGKATVTLPKSLTVGTHRLVAVYAGTPGFFGSSGAAKSFVVTKAKSTVSAKLAKKTIKKSSRGKVAITVKATGLVPAGSVVVKDGKKVLKTVKLSKGKVTVTLPKLKKGKHKISVSYKGSSTVAGGSRTVTLTVKK